MDRVSNSLGLVSVIGGSGGLAPQVYLELVMITNRVSNDY